MTELRMGERHDGTQRVGFGENKVSWDKLEVEAVIAIGGKAHENQLLLRLLMVRRIFSAGQERFFVEGAKDAG